MTAREKKGAPTVGKSDAIDALAIPGVAELVATGALCPSSFPIGGDPPDPVVSQRCS